MLRLDAYKVYLIMGAVAAFATSMIFTILAVYYVQEVGMNPLQLVLVGTLLEGTILVFEVPTGVVADTYSRRLSVIVGVALIGVCYVMQGFLPLFAAILAAEFIRGVGETFISGASSAWIADEVGESAVGRVYLRQGQVSRIGSFAGIAAGAGLATLHLALPIVLGGALLLSLSAFLALAMPETGFRPAAREAAAPWQTMREIARAGAKVVRGRPVVLMLALVGVVFGAFSEGFDRLWEAHFLQTLAFPVWPALPPVVWIGLLNAGSMVIGIAVAEALVRRLDLADGRRLGVLLFATTAGLVVSVVAFGLAPSFAVGVAAFWSGGVLRSLQYPLASTWLNQHLPSRVRATVLSMVGQADALGQVAGGPVVGFVGLRSLRAALVVAGLILTPAVVLYGRGLRLAGDEPLIEPDQPVAADA
ncbi:MAG TPA: MFS transporter [Caldilineaceae bacterium]|nr:MFS transporter [Caldilineaceae bacterium]